MFLYWSQEHQNYNYICKIEFIYSLYCSVSMSPCKKNIRMKVLKYKSQILIVHESNQKFKMQNL